MWCVLFIVSIFVSLSPHLADNSCDEQFITDTFYYCQNRTSFDETTCNNLECYLACLDTNHAACTTLDIFYYVDPVVIRVQQRARCHDIQFHDTAVAACSITEVTCSADDQALMQDLLDDSMFYYVTGDFTTYKNVSCRIHSLMEECVSTVVIGDCDQDRASYINEYRNLPNRLSACQHPQNTTLFSEFGGDVICLEEYDDNVTDATGLTSTSVTDEYSNVTTEISVSSTVTTDPTVDETDTSMEVTSLGTTVTSQQLTFGETDVTLTEEEVTEHIGTPTLSTNDAVSTLDSTAESSTSTEPIDDVTSESAPNDSASVTSEVTDVNMTTDISLSNVTTAHLDPTSNATSNATSTTPAQTTKPPTISLANSDLCEPNILRGTMEDQGCFGPIKVYLDVPPNYCDQLECVLSCYEQISGECEQAFFQMNVISNRIHSRYYCYLYSMGYTTTGNWPISLDCFTTPCYDMVLFVITNVQTKDNYCKLYDSLRECEPFFFNDNCLKNMSDFQADMIHAFFDVCNPENSRFMEEYGYPPTPTTKCEYVGSLAVGLYTDASSVLLLFFCVVFVDILQK